MRGFDFTILGSSEEGFPNALMESMARAIPVVATAVGGVTELVTDRIHGLLVAFGDAAAMAGAIIWMIEHPDERRTMGASGRARIASEFSTERMVSATQAVYGEMLHRGEPDRPSR
jgi:glycosyltransferase involved in cell wall biosynthesis